MLRSNIRKVLAVAAVAVGGVALLLPVGLRRYLLLLLQQLLQFDRRHRFDTTKLPPMLAKMWI